MQDLFYPAGQNNVGGLFQIWFVPIVGIASMSGVNVTFRAGYDWLTCYGTEGSKGYTEEEEDSDQGPVFTITIEGFLPGDTLDRRRSLAEMVRHRFLINMIDNSGLVRRAGTLTEGLQLKYKFATGQLPGDRRGATLTFFGQLSVPPPVIN